MDSSNIKMKIKMNPPVYNSLIIKASQILVFSFIFTVYDINRIGNVVSRRKFKKNTNNVVFCGNDCWVIFFSRFSGNQLWRTLSELSLFSLGHFSKGDNSRLPVCFPG